VSDTLYVTPAQVLAAKLAVELSEEDGEEPDEALKAIANARVVAEDESAPTQPSDLAERAKPALTRLVGARRAKEHDWDDAMEAEVARSLAAAHLAAAHLPEIGLP
jgi:hypothetical protein